MKNKKNCILIADDDIDDQLMLKDAFAQCKLEKTVNSVNNGEELLNYLYRIGEYKEKEKYPEPAIILLDLNMPRKDGKTALKEIRKDHRTSISRIPVIILSTSTRLHDILEAYELGANSYITKPESYAELLKMAAKVKEYWFETVKIPVVV